MHQKTGPEIVQLGFFDFKRFVEAIYGLVVCGRMLRGLGFRNALVRIGRVRLLLLLLLWVVDGLLVRLLIRLLRLLRRSLLKALGRIIITSRLSTHRCIPVRRKI